MDFSVYINSANSAFQKVVKPLVELFKLKSEVTALRLKEQEHQEIIRKLEQRCKELEAPEHAKKLGHELCPCTYPTQIMLQIAPYKFKCEKCRAIKNIGGTVSGL